MGSEVKCLSSERNKKTNLNLVHSCVCIYAKCIKTFVVTVLLPHVKTTEPLGHAEVKGTWVATMSRLAPFLGRSC